MTPSGREVECPCDGPLGYWSSLFPAWLRPRPLNPRSRGRRGPSDSFAAGTNPSRRQRGNSCAAWTSSTTTGRRRPSSGCTPSRGACSAIAGSSSTRRRPRRRRFGKPSTSSGRTPRWRRILQRFSGQLEGGFLIEEGRGKACGPGARCLLIQILSRDRAGLIRVMGVDLVKQSIAYRTFLPLRASGSQVRIRVPPSLLSRR